MKKSGLLGLLLLITLLTFSGCGGGGSSSGSDGGSADGTSSAVDYPYGIESMGFPSTHYGIPRVISIDFDYNDQDQLIAATVADPYDSNASITNHYTFDPDLPSLFYPVDLDGDWLIPDTVLSPSAETASNTPTRLPGAILERDDNYGSINFVYSFSYDSQDQLTNVSVKSEDQGSSVFTYSHDQGKLTAISKEKFDEGSNLVDEKKITYTYTDGHLTKEEEWNLSETPEYVDEESTYSNAFDTEGRITTISTVKSSRDDNSNELTKDEKTIHIYTYNENNRLATYTEETVYNGTPSPEKYDYTFTYGEQGYLTKYQGKRYVSDNSVFLDDNGDPVSTWSYPADPDKTLTLEFTYDDNRLIAIDGVSTSTDSGSTTTIDPYIEATFTYDDSDRLTVWDLFNRTSKENVHGTLAYSDDNNSATGEVDIQELDNNGDPTGPPTTHTINYSFAAGAPSTTVNLLITDIIDDNDFENPYTGEFGTYTEANVVVPYPALLGAGIMFQPTY
ncbi:hypothetical protein SAMN05660420_01659 [Desulfuromusa kysingii]|uniref:Uncharacterized protein n=1 Tax=Desulfuromusa kysingii TaxID=37625 RepID=A0A1H3ZSY9_9BACT|nr:hypothetical protein [Desulfuromusa kysingii]SEA26725.1 hypothetical protein SAMN05660420_01659 [Desulfuromusa kysingii]